MRYKLLTTMVATILIALLPITAAQGAAATPGTSAAQGPVAAPSNGANAAATVAAPSNGANAGISAAQGAAATIAALAAQGAAATGATLAPRGAAVTARNIIWQPNYYEHVIRNEFALNKIRGYIINNPDRERYDLDGLDVPKK